MEANSKHEYLCDVLRRRVREFAQAVELYYDIHHEKDPTRIQIRFSRSPIEIPTTFIIRIEEHETEESLIFGLTNIFNGVLSKFGLKFKVFKKLPEIKNVIFNDPATIVLWSDGTKTVVKCQDGDVYSEEVGLAMAISKKALGNQGNFNNVFKKWVPETNSRENIITMDIPAMDIDKLPNLVEQLNERWRKFRERGLV